MTKTNNKSIVFGLKILSILAFSLLIIPAKASAEGGINYVYAFYPNPAPINQQIKNNPEPTISSISPSSDNKGASAKIVTITGDGFVPSSIARVNGSDRLTTFIDSSHLLVQLTPNDMYRSDGFYITVFNFNGAPGGGFSNAASFKIKTPITSTANVNNNNGSNSYSNTPNNSTSSNPTQTDNTTDTNDNYSALASNAIFGSGGFIPSGLIQWILVAIAILIIVILTRKVFGAKKNYESAPLKHA